MSYTQLYKILVPNALLYRRTEKDPKPTRCRTLHQKAPQQRELQQDGQAIPVKIAYA